MQIAIETMWKNYNTINEWIRFSDTKAGAIIAANGVIATIVFSKLAEAKGFFESTTIFLILLIIGILASFFSIILSLVCLTPTLKIGKTKSSLIFFANIAEKFTSSNDYEKATLNALKNDEQAFSQISQQVWANSKVAWKKYKIVTWATYFLELTILIGIIGIFRILASYISKV